MARRRLFFQLYPPFLLVAALALFAVSWHASSAFKSFYLSQVRDNLEARAKLLRSAGSKYLESGSLAKLNSICEYDGKEIATRFTVVDSKGKVLADTDKDYSLMENHSDRPELIDASKGSFGVSVRYSSTLKRNMMYVAVPFKSNGKLLGVFRASVPIDSIDEAMDEIYTNIFLVGIVTACLAGIVSYLLVKKITRPLEEIKLTARKIAAGNFDTSIPMSDTEEIGELAISLNHMAEQLKQKLKDITVQRNELDAILSSMREGVVAIDSDARIISVNAAAGRLFGVSSELSGRTLYETVRNMEFQAFAESVLESGEPLKKELTFHNAQERCLQLNGSVLKDMDGKSIGALIVINDNTQVRRLENLRRDFVANVSHEIKTPLTVIKGAVETLQSGAIKNPDDAECFMNIIAKHSDRLSALVEDILSLSSIEKTMNHEALPISETLIENVIDTAVDLCREKADGKNIKIKIDCEPGLTALLDRPLFEQALVNLIDNAIKYSNEDSLVEVSAASIDKERLFISVTDHGCGIPEEHFSRLFERFYRVDKARSREVGGTGLGLAIVKHIAQVHNGSVEVKSEVNKGSAFSIILPTK